MWVILSAKPWAWHPVDANWGLSTDVVCQFCRQSAHLAVLMPSDGRFVGASSIPFSE
jgi:hypothetical protein